MAWHGTVGFGTAGSGKAGSGEVRHGKAREGEGCNAADRGFSESHFPCVSRIRQALLRQGWERCGKARQGTIRLDQARHGKGFLNKEKTKWLKPNKSLK